MNPERLSCVWATFDEMAATPVGVMAKRDGLSFKDTNNTKWFRVLLDNADTVAVSALIHVKEGVVRSKSSFVLPEWRREGVLSYLILWAMVQSAELGYETITGIVRPASKAALVKLGWEETAHNKVFYQLDKLESKSVDVLYRRIRGEETIS